MILPLRRWLTIGVALVCALGLVSELAYANELLPGAIAGFFSLSAEENLPTWVASALLLICGLQLWQISLLASARAESHVLHWRILGTLFCYFSLDECAQLHEELGGHFGGSGVLYFDWVIPASIFVLVVGIAFLPFLRALPGLHRARFVIAGVLYVGGALALELPLGWWTERHGADNLGYALIDWIEESLELCGAALFLWSLAEYRRAHYETATVIASS